MSSRLRLTRQGARPQGCGQGLDRRTGVTLKDPAQSAGTLADQCAIVLLAAPRAARTEHLDMASASLSRRADFRTDIK
jgi:hypothetical protein